MARTSSPAKGFPQNILLAPELSHSYVQKKFRSVHPHCTKADSRANPIPSFRFWSGRKNKISFMQIETGFLRGDDTRGHLFFGSCDSAVRYLDSENPSPRRLLLCLAPCPVHFARPWTQASKPAMTNSSLAAKRRAEALHVVCFPTKHPSPAR